ncbi:spherulin 1B precursor [Fusarium albosuccineum]|uniref:Spherulin 1B n=1 Tax=Fusarium albosuccineum TaxID=1237068 RepID=A0A8H4KFS2_9HYPO|nr:spherulin 1B precursor [Fusarium albosuccineum]
MFSNTFFSTVTAVLAYSSFAAAAPQVRSTNSTPEVSPTTKLRQADTSIDRYKLLPSDKDFVFNIKDIQTGFADAKSFPALTGTGTSLAVAEIPGCSMVMVHLHPRASEVFALLSGKVYTETIPEAGVNTEDGKPRVIRNELSPGDVTVFYQGAFHTQVNPDCEPASAVAAFASEDLGTTVIAPALFSLSDEVITRTFGQSIAGEDIDKVRHALPQGITIKVDECLAKCGKQKRQA